MDRGTVIRRGLIASSIVALLAAYGCDQPNPYKVQGTPPNCPPPPADIGEVGSPGTNQTTPGNTPQNENPGNEEEEEKPGEEEQQTTELDERVIDYSEALRVASLKLVGELPNNDDIYAIANAEDEDAKRAAYEELVDAMMDADNEEFSSKFAERLVNFYRQEFHIAQDQVNPQSPSRDTAPTFAARLIYEGGNWQNLLTAASNTCPTWDAENGFMDGECSNAASLANMNESPVGVLTDPGIMSVYYGNLAFRRNRFMQETFLCRYGNDPIPETSVDGADLSTYCDGEEPPAAYQGVWPFDSIGGACSEVPGKVDFHEHNATTICAQCHGTWNHRSPLWGKFDVNGNYFSTFQVKVPVEGEPFAALTDWLSVGALDGYPENENAKPFAWRHDLDRVRTLAQLGTVMANDPEVISCAVKRVWNYAMSHGDIVDNNSDVPQAVIGDLVDDFTANGYNMKQTLRSILLHEDFVSF